MSLNTMNINFTPTERQSVFIKAVLKYDRIFYGGN
jgi:hypothetical protein